MSHLTSITDARLKTTSFEVDAFGRVRKVTYPGGRFEEFTYGGAGRLKTRKDRKSVTTTYTYDGLGRLKTKTYDNGAPGVTFTYDEGPVDHKGRLTTAANVSDMLTWEYNLAGQVLNERSAFNTTTTGVIYDYYLDGSRKTVTLNNGVVGYDYFDDGQLHHVTWRPDADPDTYSFTFDPDAAHRRRSLAYPNGAVTTYTPDLLSRLENVKTMVGSNPITEWAYTYNAMGNRTSRSAADSRLDYSYDPVDRLRETLMSPPPCEEPCTPALPIPREMYTYDQVGNRLTALGTSGAWSYSDRNELLSNSSASFTYDLNGNLETKVEGNDSWTYVWSVENELLRVCQNVSPCTDVSATARFKYDALGRRIQKVAGGVTRNFTYDGEDILRERIPQVKNYRYVHGPGVDEPLAVQDMSMQGDTGLSYYHADALGSIVSRTDPSGAVTLTRNYFGSFGRPGNGADVPGYAFTGREWDPETGLYYYRARYYDPKVGRFISEDPIGWYGGLNLYGYVGNNAVRWVDPFGLEPGAWYANKNQAAKAAMRDIFPPANVEYCGNICPIPGGMTYDPAKTDNDPGGCRPEPKCSNGAEPSAMYHSHPPGSDPVLSTYFSGDDSLTAGCMGFGSCKPVYMVCYQGQMQKLRPDATHRTIGWIR